MSIRRWLGFDEDESVRTAVGDLREGRAGLPARVAVSLGLAAFLSAVTIFSFGVLEVLLSVDDDWLALFLGLAAALWCALIIPIWAGTRRGGRILRSVLMILAIWSIVIPASVIVDSLFGRIDQYLIGALVLSGIAASLWFVAVAVWRTGATRRRRRRPINLRCASCGYPLQGLRDLTCPECGRAYTLDELVELAVGPEEDVEDAEMPEDGAEEPDAPAREGLSLRERAG